MPQTARMFAKMLCFVVLMPLLTAAAAFAQAPPNAPQTQYWVTDQAGILAASVEQSLTRNAQTYEDDTTIQFVTVTIKTLDGWTIERYGRWLGNEWGIGQADKDNGVLLLVAPNDRKVRIEVGRGLETTLTDAIALKIIENEILPAFRDGNLEAGVIAGHKAVIEALGGTYTAPTQWDKFLQFLLLPFFVLSRLLGFGGRGSGGFSGGGGSFGGGGASGSW